MKKIAVSVCMLVLVWAGLAGEITVTGTGRVKRQPDKMNIMFSVSSTDPDMAGARNAFADKTAVVAAALAAAGVSSNEVIRAGMYMNRSYSYEAGRQKFEGYQFTENYTFSAAMDRARLARIKQELFKSEAIGSLDESFELFDPEKLRGEARTTAVANARTIAEGLAAAAGVKLGDIVSIEYGGGGDSTIRYRNMVMAKGVMSDEAEEFGESGIGAQLRDLSVSDSVVIRWNLE